MAPSSSPNFSHDGGLGVAQHLRAQLDVAGLVDAVDVAEGQRGHVVAAVAVAERPRGGDGVLGGRVELVVDVVRDAVLLAADHADLDLEDDLRRDALLEQLLGDGEVLVELDRRAVPHVRLEQRRLPAPDPLDREVEQRADEAVELVLGAVVGVQRDVHRVVLRHLGRVRREGQRAGHHVLDRGAGEVVGATGGDLHDPVGARLGEARERGVQGLRGRDVDRRVGELAAFAASSISAYFSGVAMGMRGGSSDGGGGSGPA